MLESGEVTRILQEVRCGDADALKRLIAAVYQELRRLAQHYMQGQRPDHSLQATELVHEAYLRLAGHDAPDWQNRAHFLAVAAQVMRNLLVDHARARQRLKRGGGGNTQLDEALILAGPQSEELMAVHEALERLAALDPRQGRIVELRYFGGLSIDEVAAVLGVSDRTVKREWQIAKAWLRSHVEV